MSKKNQTTTPTFPLVAAILTVLLVLGAIAVIALELLEIANGRRIEEAAETSLAIPLVSAGLLAISVGWLIWLVRQYGIRHIVTIIVSGVVAILLVATPLFTWQAFTSSRDITVVSMTCDAETLRNTGGTTMTTCTDDVVESIVLLEGVKSRDQWVPDESTGNLTREFRDLPGGTWETILTVDGPADTVAVTAVGENGSEQVRLGSFRPYMDAESGRLRWSAHVTMEDDISTVKVLFYLSANPAVDSASLRFDIRECSGQNARSFDATQCQPLESTASFVMEKSPPEARTWRHPLVTREGTAMVITNLEARTYVLEPDYTSIEMVTQSTDVLIIPSAMPQIAENSITEPGASTFEVPIESNTGELVYTVYVFPSGPTYAGSDVDAS